ncbi:MAG: radical SAM protein [Bacteroidota bacterium]
MGSKIISNYLPEIFALSLNRTKPSKVAVNLTNRCNQRCIYCEIGQNGPAPVKSNLCFNDLRWILDEMHKNKICKISLCGGEPFLFDSIIDVVAYAATKSVRCSITSNGMTAHALNDNDLAILKDCKAEINISVDSFQDDIQSVSRGTSSALSNALKSIQKLCENGIPVTLLCVISKYNFRDLSNVFIKAHEIGLKKVLFQPVIYYSNYPERSTLENKSSLNVSPDQFDILLLELSRILEFEKKNNISSNVYRIIPWISAYLLKAGGQGSTWFFKDLLNKFYCRDLYAIVDIAYDGGIQPCGLVQSSISIMNNRDLGLIALWTNATEKIKFDLSQGHYYECCNGCCHHFSRNMLASMIKYPLNNRLAVVKMIPLLLARAKNRMYKNLFVKN